MLAYVLRAHSHILSCKHVYICDIVPCIFCIYVYRFVLWGPQGRLAIVAKRATLFKYFINKIKTHI